MRQTQSENACGCIVAVNGNSLHLHNRSRAVLHQRIIKSGAGESNGFAGDVGLVKCPDKTDHIALPPSKGCILHNADIGNTGLQQIYIGLLEVGKVLGHVVGHKNATAFDCGCALTFDLQGHQTQRLSRQISARRNSKEVGSRLGYAELRT